MRIRRALWWSALLLAAVAAWWATRVPIDRGHWSPDQARIASYASRGDTVTIANVRDADPRTRAPRWEARTFDLAGLDSVWLAVAPFSEGWRGLAHIFVTFGFADGQRVAISVEARRGPGEGYSVLAGVMHRYQVLYVVGTERDLIGRRVWDAEGPVYLYPIRATPAAIRTLFTSMLDRAVALGEHPEFYNTLTNNCTSNLIAHVQPLVRERIPSAWLSVMPGYSDAVAHRLGLIADDADLATERLRYRIPPAARAALDSADFSSQIRRSR